MPIEDMSCLCGPSLETVRVSLSAGWAALCSRGPLEVVACGESQKQNALLDDVRGLGISLSDCVLFCVLTNTFVGLNTRREHI